MGTFCFMRICECGHPRTEHTRLSAQAVLRANEGRETLNVPRDNPPTDSGFTVTEASTSGLVDDEHSVPPKHDYDTEETAEDSVSRINTMAERQQATVGGNVLRQEERERLEVDQTLDDEAQANLNVGEDPAPCNICPDCNDWRPVRETIAPADDQTNDVLLAEQDPDRVKTDVQIQNEKIQAMGDEQNVFDEEPSAVAEDNVVNNPEQEEGNERLLDDGNAPAPTADDSADLGDEVTDDDEALDPEGDKVAERKAKKSGKRS